jgi:hypothetical protein
MSTTTLLPTGEDGTPARPDSSTDVQIDLSGTEPPRRGLTSRIRTMVRAHWLVILALIIGLVVGNLTSGASHLRVDLRNATQKNADFGKQVDGLNGRVSELEGTGKDLQGQLSEAQGQNSDLQGANGQLQGQVDDLKGQLAAANAKRPIANLSGKTRDDVQAMADEFGWDASFSEQGSDKPKGTVISQSPKPGTVMRLGAAVSVVLAKPFPPSWKDLNVWSGRGSFNTDEVNIPDGEVRLVYSFTGGSNAIIILKERPDEFVELFLNEIGDRSGSTRVYYSGKYYFNIEGDSWTVRLQVFK